MSILDSIFKVGNSILKSGFVGLNVPTKMGVLPSTPNLFKPETNAGIVENTIRGLPQAGYETLVRPILRTGVSFGGDVRNVLVKPKNRVFETQVPKTLQGALGKEPIQTLAYKTALGEQSLKESPLAQKLGIGGKYALPAAFAGTIGLATLDLTPFGGMEKNAAKMLLKETSAIRTAKILRSMKVKEELIPSYSNAFAKANTEKEVTSLLKTLKQDVKNKPLQSFNDLQPELKEGMLQYVNDIKNGVGARPINTQRIVDVFKRNGINAPDEPKKLAGFIDDMAKSASSFDSVDAQRYLASIDKDAVREIPTQKSIAMSRKETAPISNISSRIIRPSISEKPKSFLQKIVDKYKSIPNKEGGFARIPGKKINRAEYDEGYFNKKLSPELEQKKLEIEIRKEALANNPLNALSKYEARRGDFKGQLPEVIGTGGKFAKKGDQLALEVTGKDMSSEELRAAYSVFKDQKMAVQEAEQALRDEIKATTKKTTSGDFKGTEIAKEAKQLGSDQGGLSDFTLNKIKEEDYNTVKVSIADLRKADPDLDAYLKTSPVRDYVGEPFGMDPIVRSDGEVLDGYNRIAQVLADGKEEIYILRGISKPVRYSAEGIPLAIPKSMKARLERQTIEGQPRMAKPHPSPVQEMTGGTGELRSIERQAEQSLARETLPQTLRESSSLPKIVEKLPTPVKQKVGILDYIKTPEKVLQKLGLSKQMDEIRRGYDGYIKELPKNMEKIGDWAKSLPKESSKRIFQWLDGKAIDLTPQEMKVADEIRAWLKEWADRLDLPEDKRIADYITHIFDDQLLKKEFDEDLAKIIADKIPGSVYNPFLQSRLGAKGYKEDVWAALDAYAKRATRKVHMDPALAKLEEASVGLEDSQWKYVKSFADRINMRPTDMDIWIDNSIKQIFESRFMRDTTKLLTGKVRGPGQRPTTVVSKMLRRWTYRGMLGLNPGSALRNLSQGINTYAKLGEKYTVKGYMSLFSKTNQKELLESGVLNSSFVQDRALSAVKKTMEKMDKGLFYMFEKAEQINRGAAYFGAKAKAINEGKSLEEAVEYAKKIVRETQFQFGSIDTPVGMSSDIVKTLTQFQTFTTKQAEFLANMMKNEEYAGLVRYTISGLVFVYTIGKAFGMKPEELIPGYSFLSGRGYGVPPSLRGPWETLKAVANVPDEFGQERTTGEKIKDVANTLPGYLPAGGQIKKTVQGAKAIQQGGSYDAAGRLQFVQEQSLPAKAQALLFGKYASDNAQDYFQRGEIAKDEKKRVQPTFDKVQSLVKEGKNDDAVALYDSLSENDKATYKKIRSSEKAKKNQEGKKNILSTFNRVQSLTKEGKKEEAVALYDALSEEEQGYYKMVLGDMRDVKNKSGGREYNPTVLDHIKAYYVDPANALKATFTEEKLAGGVKGNLVELQRFYGIKYTDKGGSQEYKKKAMEAMGLDWKTQQDDYKLEHILPVSAGGGNGDDNLVPINNAEHDSYTPVDIAVGSAVENGIITRGEANNLMVKLKVEKSITSQDIYEVIKK